jgi:hypothetical protein
MNILFREETLVRLNSEKAQFSYFSPAYWTLTSAIMELRTNHIGVHVFVFITDRYFLIQIYPWHHTGYTGNTPSLLLLTISIILFPISGESWFWYFGNSSPATTFPILIDGNIFCISYRLPCKFLQSLRRLLTEAVSSNYESRCVHVIAIRHARLSTQHTDSYKSLMDIQCNHGKDTGCSLPSSYWNNIYN